MTLVGILDWVKSYRFISISKAYSIAKAESGNGVIITGQYTESGDNDIMVMEVDEDGEVGGSNSPTTEHVSESDIFANFVTNSLSSSDMATVSYSSGTYLNTLS